MFRSISSSRHADAITPTEPLGAVAVSPSGIGLPLNSGGSASAIVLFEACSAFTHVSACLFARSPKVTFTRVLQRMSLPPCAALVASGRATDWPGGIRTHWRSPTCTAYWFVDQCHALIGCCTPDAYHIDPIERQHSAAGNSRFVRIPHLNFDNMASLLCECV